MQQIDYQDIKKRLMAAQAVFDDATTPKERLNSLRVILKGIHPDIDRHLEKTEREFSKLESIFSGAVIDLSVELLPEKTEEEKKRKKAVLLFLGYWNQLKKEIVRVQKEFNAAEQSSSGDQTQSPWGKIFGVVKGPLGIVTVIAVGVVVALQTTAVTVDIVNQGCSAIAFPASIPELPGMKLPKEPIPAGGSGTATIPPLSVEVDNTEGSTIAVTALGFSGSFSLSNGVTDVMMDGASLLGKKTEVHLSKRKEHSLTFVCGV